MKTVSSFPHPVRELEHVLIPMPDGCRLAARIWMPEDAESVPVPAILEYIPYRKNDHTAVRDASMHPYVAGHGYAVVRLDLRGAGDSEGLLLDEYLQQEIQDGHDAVQWIAKQPWCDGNVGMMGISWGGFNGLQVAAEQPDALKAIITLCSSEDRYAVDVHYMEGCLLGEQLSWASIMFGRNTLPPDPRHHGERWREMWHERLRHSGLWLKNWLEHQRRDAYWKHGSICDDWSRVRVPVYAVSGWADGYCRTVLRLMQHLDVPRKGLVGPWSHKYPHLGAPGPAIGFLQEALRWWDYWLKGRDTGIMDEPMLRMYMQDSARPAAWYGQRDGRWVAEPSWPSPSVSPASFRVSADGRLTTDAEAQPEGKLTHCSPLDVGMMAGKWCSYAQPGDQPGDQRTEDAGSLCFETAPLQAPLEIAGEAKLVLDVAVDRPVAQVAARLVDVWPDGAATRVAYGVLNLTHRDSHEAPEPMKPGERCRVTVPFKPVAQRFEAGHRIRLAVSTSYFPMIWTAPEPVTMTVHTGGTSLELPVRAPSDLDAGLEPFAGPEATSALEKVEVEEPNAHWRVIHDVGADRVEMRTGDGAGTYRLVAGDLTMHSRGSESYSIAGDDPLSATGEVEWEHAMSRGDWRIRTLTRTRLKADRERFLVEASLEAWEGDDLAHEAHWEERIDRDLL